MKNYCDNVTFVLRCLGFAVLTSCGSQALTSAATLPPMPSRDAAAGSAPAITTSAEDYCLSAGDAISVTVVDNPNLSVSQVTISPAGTISLPLVGALNVKGQTTQQVNALLTQRYSKYLVSPSVSAALVTKHPDYLYVTGYVQHPGAINYDPAISVLGAVAQAGGAATDGDLTAVVVTHKDSTVKTYNLGNPESSDGASLQSTLYPEDVIYVPDQHNEVSVVGDVLHPGTVTYQEKMTVLDAVTNVGGVLETADLSAATITHNGKETPLDLQALLRNGDSSKNIILTSGDRILVPTIAHRTFVYGAVAHPGMYVVKPGDHVLDALNAVGGPVQNASLSHIRILHAGPSGKLAVREVDVLKYLKTGRGGGNVLLSQGDVVYVPDPKRHFEFNDLIGLLNGVDLVNVGAHTITHGLGN